MGFICAINIFFFLLEGFFGYLFIVIDIFVVDAQVNASDVIILEGILVFHDQGVRDLMNMKIFVDTGLIHFYFHVNNTLQWCVMSCANILIVYKYSKVCEIRSPELPPSLTVCNISITKQKLVMTECRIRHPGCWIRRAITTWVHLWLDQLIIVTDFTEYESLFLWIFSHPTECYDY